MTDEAKKKYIKMAEDDKKRFEKETEQMQKLGYFINKDGVKSTSILPEIKNFPADTVLPDKSKSAYNFYSSHCHKEFMAANPGIKVTDIMKKKSEAWNCMKDAQKKQFEDMSTLDKARYEAELT